MKEFARVTLSIKNANPAISQRLEQVLSREIAISTGKDTYYQALSPQDYAPHHNTLAQARFQFLPLAEKALELKKNVAYQQDLDRIRQLRNLLQASGNAELESKLLGSSQEFYKLCEEIDTLSTIDPSVGTLLADNHLSVIDRLKKTQESINQEASRAVLERFGIKGVNLDNIEQVYNPVKTGITSMSATRTFLIQKGMSEELADSLAKRYLNRLETSKSVSIVSLMDLFNSSTSQASAEALSALLKANLATEVCLNYQTWGDYQQTVQDKLVRSLLQQHFVNTLPLSGPTFQPVRPLSQRGFFTSLGRRGFSSQPSAGKENLKYTEEYLTKQSEQQTQKKGKFFEFIKKIDTMDAAPEAGKAVKSDYDLDELDISFDKVSKGAGAATIQPAKEGEEETSA